MVKKSKVEEPKEEKKEKKEKKPKLTKYLASELRNKKTGEVDIIDGTKLDNVYVCYPIEGEGISITSDFKTLKEAYNLKEIMDIVN
ncbi:MAG: hypothetical protein HQ538_01750 [Parcubacteria group bacterium]|nr:hypothetical protein [Parcubacteria group bacterium]